MCTLIAPKSVDADCLRQRILREVRARHRTYISKASLNPLANARNDSLWPHQVILHPSNVVEVQIKKEKTTTRAGQYIFL